MAILEASAQWQGGMEFLNQLGDHAITTDAPLVYGGKNRGPKPTHMLLAGLMGCTGMDVASLLAKMRVPVEKINLDSRADVAEEDPHVFHSIVLNYRFDSSSDLEPFLKQITSAIGLSKSKLCCVSIMFRQFCSIEIHAYVNGRGIELHTD
jgi:putative redox protein